MSRDIGIDLGTATVLVYVKGKGIVLEEPSVVAIDKLTDKVICVGREAQQMQGRTPPNIEVVRPMRDGVISRYEVTLQMLRHFLNKAYGGAILWPRMMVCIPSGITEVEERAVIDAANQSGARKTYLIEEPVAAALGADIDISMPNGNLIVDIGGGTTDIALISSKGSTSSSGLPSSITMRFPYSLISAVSFINCFFLYTITSDNFAVSQYNGTSVYGAKSSVDTN